MMWKPEPGPVEPTTNSVFVKVVECLHRRRVPGEAHRARLVHAADPVEFRCLELHRRHALQRRGGKAGVHHADDGAVLGRDVVEVVDGAHAAAAHHVLHHDVRIARNVPTHVAGERSRIDVVAAADAGRDGEVDGLAAIEIRHLVGR